MIGAIIGDIIITPMFDSQSYEYKIKYTWA